MNRLRKLLMERELIHHKLYYIAGGFKGLLMALEKIEPRIAPVLKDLINQLEDVITELEKDSERLNKE